VITNPNAVAAGTGNAEPSQIPDDTSARKHNAGAYVTGTADARVMADRTHMIDNGKFANSNTRIDYTSRPHKNTGSQNCIRRNRSGWMHNGNERKPHTERQCANFMPSPTVAEAKCDFANASLPKRDKGVIRIMLSKYFMLWQQIRSVWSRRRLHKTRYFFVE